jgi:hypothetical protein
MWGVVHPTEYGNDGGAKTLSTLAVPWPRSRKIIDSIAWRTILVHFNARSGATREQSCTSTRGRRPHEQQNGVPKQSTIEINELQGGEPKSVGTMKNDDAKAKTKPHKYQRSIQEKTFEADQRIYIGGIIKENNSYKFIANAFCLRGIQRFNRRAVSNCHPGPMSTE